MTAQGDTANAQEPSTSAGDEFLANMSYEVRTPVNSILILSQQLAENAEGNLSPKQVTFAQTIHAAATDLLNLFDDMLELSKVRSGTITLDIEDISLSGLIEATVTPFRQEANARGLTFDVNIDAVLGRTIVTDARRLRQVLKGLLSNAFAFTNGGVKLSVFAAAGSEGTSVPHSGVSSDAIVFEVTDTGLSHPPEKQRIIFEAFQQSGGGKHPTRQRSGLGLSISRVLATMLGGEIRLHSTPGSGSTFTLNLPARYGSPSGKLRAEPADAPKVETFSAPRVGDAELRAALDAAAEAVGRANSEAERRERIETELNRVETELKAAVEERRRATAKAEETRTAAESYMQQVSERAAAVERLEKILREQSAARSPPVEKARDSATGVDAEVLEQRYRRDALARSQKPSEAVACSVFAPLGMRPLAQAVIQVFLHPPDAARAVAALASETDPDRGRQITRELDLPLAQGNEVEVYLETAGLAIDAETPRRQVIIWQGKPASVSFLVQAPFSILGRNLLPVVRLAVRGQPVGHIAFRVRVRFFGNTQSAFMGEARRYRRAFLSYATEDRAEVLKRAQALRLAGIEVFQDFLSLEPGERWSQRLRDEIDNADVFYLFWSNAAQRSRWVLREARHALRRQRGSAARTPDIVPIVLAVPPPTPPHFLRHIHFNDPVSTAIAYHGTSS